MACGAHARVEPRKGRHHSERPDVIASLPSGMPVTIMQATNNNTFAEFALQRPTMVGKSCA
jgi:hypothetical protein